MTFICTTTIRRSVAKQCPFKDETDAGELTITFTGDAPELHALDKEVNALTATPISHEDFTWQIATAAERAGMVMKVTTTWHTGAWSVEVTAEDEGEVRAR